MKSYNRFSKVTLVIIIILSVILLFKIYNKGLNFYSKYKEAKKISVRGSETLLSLNYEWAKYYYTNKNDKIRIEITGGGSGVGIISMINGIVDLASSSRKVNEKEVKKLESKNKSIQEWKVSLDSIIIYVHKSNKVDSISLEDLKNIYLGKITNWKELGWKDQKIIPYGRESSSGTYNFFKKIILDGSDYYNRIISLSGNATILNSIRKDESGIGYGSYSNVSYIKKLAIRVNGQKVYPSEENIKNNKYFLVRSLYLYAIKENLKRKPYILDYIDWILSSEAQGLSIKSGYFSIKDEKEV